MSGISTRIDKGTTRFQPKLKAQPRQNRGKANPSENGTPAPTPSVGGSDSGSFGASLMDETGSSASSNITSTAAAGAATTGAATASASAMYSPAQKEPSRRMSTATPMSPPSSHSRTIGSPRSPTTKPRTPSLIATPISLPSQKTAVESSDAGSSSAAPAVASSSSSIPSSGSAASKKTTKGASIITVPTARSHAEMDVDELEEIEEATNSNMSAASRKRSKGKNVIRPRHNSTSTLHNGGEEAVEGEGEEEVEDGEEAWPDYDNMFMHEFTKDLGVGRRSKVYLEQRKALAERRRENKKEKRIRDIRRTEGRGPSPPRELGSDEEEEAADGADNVIEDEDEAEKAAIAKEENSKRLKAEPLPPVFPTATRTFAPQVRIVDGQIVLDQDSLLVDHALVEADMNTEPMEVIEESSSTKFINSATFSRKIRSERWSEEETDLFYEAISQWGTDFGIICRLFPSKTRVSIRNKYKREDRYNHSRLEAALNCKTPIDLDQYSQMTQRHFPEVSELDAIKKLPVDEDEDQALLEDPGFEGEYEEGDEVVEEEDGEEIVGSIDEQ